ncbi:metal ABC transporter ATP-binding protein [candidate division CSSED10-310 bacterium]|uniref:Metal ABC transporter ATP-binding protein n=1 Tax=candidate division CSSED10-310 bacterium TaxID=2855610 RepID=A0ABV6YZR1_UNCC1
MTDQIVISMKDVSFSYNAVPTLENVSLLVKDREFVSVVGPNGGGKTTLLKLLLGLLKPDKGDIRIFGKTPFQVRHQVGYMPQYIQFDPKFPMTVMDVVLMGRLGTRWGGPYSREDKKAALDAIELVGLADLTRQLLSSLSGGQRQRILLARALASNPELLLLDEPTANVDIIIGGKLFEILRQLNKRMAILIVSHDLGFVSQVVQKVMCVNKRVVIHPTSTISGEIIQEIYGCEMQMVRHDHSHSEENMTCGGD